MISKQYFEETFSLTTAQNLQAWADANIIITPRGDYAMKISYLGAGEMFAETEVTGLTIGNEYILKTDTVDITSNVYRTKVNALPNDNTSMVAELPWGTGARELIFTATAEIMYIAIGDEIAAPSTFSVVDNVSLKIEGIEAVSNGTFEAGNTTGWYAQGGNSTLSVYEYVVEPDENPYIEPVNIPTYVDTGDDTDGLITVANGRWNNTYLNRADIKNFYIEPGDYASLDTATLTTDGSAIEKRTISLHNGNDTHPGALPANTTEQASISIKIQSDYWVLDRLAILGARAYGKGVYISGSNNIVNRLLADDHNYTVQIIKDGNFNTVQYSRFQQMREGDTVSVEIRGDHNDDSVIEGTKVILNEFYNQNDGFQAVRRVSNNDPSRHESISGPDTVIDSNIFYIDENTAYESENAIDLKFGSSDPLKPILVTNNKMWGYSIFPYGTTAVVGHYNVRNLQLNDNIFYNSITGIGVGAGANEVVGEGTLKTGLVDSEIKRNLIYDGGYASQHQPLKEGSLRTNTEDNTYIDCVFGIGSFYLNDADSTYLNNDICNTPDYWDDLNASGTSRPSDPAYIAQIEGVTNVHYPTSTDAGYTEDLVIDYDVYTANPKQLTITNAVKP